MIRLHGTSRTRWDAEPFVARVTTDNERAPNLRTQEVLVMPVNGMAASPGFRAYLAFNDDCCGRDCAQESHVLSVPQELNYLADGDVILCDPRSGRLSVLYRRHSNSNTILLTERCNCNCVMCPQPPRNSVTGNLAALWQDVIPLVGPEASDLAISGGEPTIVPDDLLSVLRACREHLPHTAVHVLTNGRMFNYLSLCQAVAEIHHPDIMLGIPLYSDLSYVHDFIVQVEGAYDQTLRGMMNLARCGQRIEVRVVLLPHNIQRLHPLACFIARNLPFVEHVAWMGLEPMGHAVRNWEEVWVDPVDYQAELTEATGELLRHRINTSIYNHPLCVLNPRLWPLARKSISDWKTEYVEACQKCGVRSDCGGIFASAVLRQSRGVHPL